jgi:Sugar phosphate permease
LTRVPEDYEAHEHHERRSWLPRHLIAPGIALGFVNVQYPVVVGFLILHLARFGNAGPAAFSAYALVILLSRFFLGGLPDRMHPKKTFYFGLAAMAAGLITIAMGPPPVLAVLGTALLGFGVSFPWSSVAASVLRETPDRERGSVIGVLSAFVDLFVGVSSFSAGLVAKNFGYSAAFLMAAVALGAAAIAGRTVFPAAVTEAAPLTVELSTELQKP